MLLTPEANLPPVLTTQAVPVAKFAAGVIDNWWVNCHQCHWYRWCTLTCKYLREFLKKFEMTLKLFSVAWGKMIYKKTWSKKSRDTVPLINKFLIWKWLLLILAQPIKTSPPHSTEIDATNRNKGRETAPCSLITYSISFKRLAIIEFTKGLFMYAVLAN